MFTRLTRALAVISLALPFLYTPASYAQNWSRDWEEMTVRSTNVGTGTGIGETSAEGRITETTAIRVTEALNRPASWDTARDTATATRRATKTSASAAARICAAMTVTKTPITGTRRSTDQTRIPIRLS